MDSDGNASDREVFCEIHALLSGWAEGKMTDTDAARLEELLRSSQRARETYLDYIQDTVLLGTIASRPGESGRLAVSDLFVGDLIEELEAEQERLRAAEEAARLKLLHEQEARDALIEPPKRKAPPPYLAISAWSALAASLLFLAWMNSGPRDRAELPQPIAKAPAPPADVATISSYFGAEPIAYESKDAEWVDVTPGVGTRLKVGKYSLPSGLVELRFDSGPLTVIQGPADFELWAKNGMELAVGKAVTKVPPAAQGFAVSTGSASIIDLGTEFAVAAGDDGGTEVLVLDGKVALKPRPAVESNDPSPPGPRDQNAQEPSAEELLTAGNARLVSADRTVTVIENPNRSKFLRSLDGLVAVDDFKNPPGGGIGFVEDWVIEQREVAFRDGGVWFDSQDLPRNDLTGDARMHRKFEAIDASSKPVYFSAEFQIGGGDPMCSCWLVLSSGDSLLHSAVIGLTDGQFTLRSTVLDDEQVKRNGSAGPYTPGSWHFLVGRYQANAVGALDKLSIWIDPAVDVPGDPQKVIVDDLGVTQIDTATVMFWNFGKAENGRGGVDNVRVGTSWAAVQ